ncbi:thioredoxin [Halogeometricum borinquense]|nr:thioredoxin [Halogeometricum borinquense]ADQ67725.1 thioredoxin [Halogeometricum borinquense DSM 11551]
MSEKSSDADELDEIRRRKRKQLESKLEDGTSPETDRMSAESPADPIDVNGGDEFESLVASTSVVLVDFYADWCGPCKMIAPTVNSLAAETTATVAKVDIDQNQTLASQYNVRGVPTLLLFSDGDPVEQVVGVRDKSTLRGLIEQYT